MTYYEKALELHEQHKGKIEISSKVALENQSDLSVAYTPGVAEPCRAIAKTPESVYRYTIKGNTVAVVSDGSAVLGLGNIGAEAAIPVMEGKALLFKKFAGVDAFPICLKSQDVDSIVQTVLEISPVFGGINLEDIASPRCVEIERALKARLDIPVFHDDQHGTAIVVCAALINALKCVDKSIEAVRIVINGAGAAGSAITQMLLSLGASQIIVCDRKGILSRENAQSNWVKSEIAEQTNSECRSGTLAEALKNADVFIGVSAGGVVNGDMVRQMSKDAIVFAMANPEPEIYPEVALAAGARIVGTGRSDFPNQINNVLAFPGLFRGALDARARDINAAMKHAAVYAIADLVSTSELSDRYIIPSALDTRVSEAVSKAVYDAAIKSGVTR